MTRIVALICFILAAVFAFLTAAGVVTDAQQAYAFVLGLVASGLAVDHL